MGYLGPEGYGQLPAVNEAETSITTFPVVGYGLPGLPVRQSAANENYWITVVNSGTRACNLKGIVEVDGEIFASGWAQTVDTNIRGLIMKFSLTGEVLAQKIYRHQSNAYCELWQIEYDPTAELLVAVVRPTSNNRAGFVRFSTQLEHVNQYLFENANEIRTFAMTKDYLVFSDQGLCRCSRNATSGSVARWVGETYDYMGDECMNHSGAPHSHDLVAGASLELEDNKCYFGITYYAIEWNICTDAASGYGHAWALHIDAASPLTAQTPGGYYSVEYVHGTSPLLVNDIVRPTADDVWVLIRHINVNHLVKRNVQSGAAIFGRAWSHSVSYPPLRGGWLQLAPMVSAEVMIVVGEHIDAGIYSVVLSALDFDGNFLWHRRIASTVTGKHVDLTFGSSGRIKSTKCIRHVVGTASFVLTCRTDTYNSNGDAVVMRLPISGDFIGTFGDFSITQFTPTIGAGSLAVGNTPRTATSNYTNTSQTHDLIDGTLTPRFVEDVE